jgi:pilus assembly protein CpaB
MTRRSRGLLVFGIAIASAGLASAAVHRAVQQRDSIVAAAPTRPVVVAARSLPMGARLTTTDLKIIEWPQEAMVEGAVSSPDTIVGLGLTRAIATNEPVTEGSVAQPGAGSGLPPAIPPGMRAISVKVDDVVGVAGFAVPGSRVDVLVALRGGSDSVARAVASNVQVLAVGTRADLEQGRVPTTASSTVVTLLVIPADAERISLASMQGNIVLTLRNPLDEGSTPSGGVRLTSLMGELVPAAPVPVRPQRSSTPVVTQSPPPEPRRYVVETIRAGKRTEETIR